MEYYSAFKNDECEHCRHMERFLLCNVKLKKKYKKQVISAQLHEKYLCFWIQENKKPIHLDDENASECIF